MMLGRESSNITKLERWATRDTLQVNKRHTYKIETVEKEKKGNPPKKRDTARPVTARESESTCSCPSFLLSTFICMFSSIISVFPFSFACLSFLFVCFVSSLCDLFL